MSGQNIRKVLTFHAKQSNEFVIVPQLLEMHVFLTLSQNIWKVCHFVSKYLRSIWCWTKTFEIYWISTQRNSKSFVLILYTKASKSICFGKPSKSIWFRPKTLKQYCMRTQNIQKVFHFGPKHSIHIKLFYPKPTKNHLISV